MNLEWKELEERIFIKIDEIEEYFKLFVGKELEGVELEKFRSKGEQFSEEFKVFFDG